MSRVLEAIANHARMRPHAPALSGGGRAWTYEALQADIDATAKTLRLALGDAPTQAPIALALDNSPEWALLDLAAIKLGHPTLPLPPFFTPEQIHHALVTTGACAIVRPARPNDRPLFLHAAAPLLTLTRVQTPPRKLPAGTAKITFTSGSTAAPKGVCLSQTQLEDVAQSIVSVVGQENAGRHFAILPMGVLLENVAGLYATLLAGGEHRQESLADIGFASPFNPDFSALAAAISEARANSLILVPELLRGLVHHWLRVSAAPESLKFVAVGGAKTSPELLDSARRLGLPVFEGYGLSECGSVVALNSPHAHASGSVGRVLPHLKISIASDGEIIVGPSPFLGYVGDARVGPVHTGDIGAIDERGFLHLSGRKSNLIVNAHGRNISPEWVESELCAQPEIGYAIVAGEAQPSLCALIAPTAQTLSPESIDRAIQRANARMPEYARIARFQIVPPLAANPQLLTGNGRPKRAAILSAYRTFVEQVV